jgi:hypothetical protein
MGFSGATFAGAEKTVGGDHQSLSMAVAGL